MACCIITFRRCIICSWWLFPWHAIHPCSLACGCCFWSCNTEGSFVICCCMHAATPGTQPRAASTRQLISKGLHIKKPYYRSGHWAPREREREFPFNWKGCARGTWSWNSFTHSIANYMIMCLDFRFQHNYFQSSRQFFCCAIWFQDLERFVLGRYAKNTWIQN